MYDWKAQFSQQRKDYVRRTLERLMAMDSLLNAVAQRPNDLSPMRELAQHFHQLAGSSAIYALDGLGKNAHEAERVCLEVLRNQTGISKPEWKQLRDLLDAMKFTCQQHPDMQADAASKGSQAAAAPQAATPAAAWNANQSAGVQFAAGSWTVPAATFAGAPITFEKPKDIVIVDGDQGNMMTLTRTFEQAGMQVRGFRTTDGAKRAVQERLPDALILSIPLIDGPGYDVAHHLRSLPDGHVPPVMIISRQIGFLDKVMAIRCGADAFFNEISEPDIILGKLQSLLDRDKPGNYTILSVEDDPDQSAFLKQVLESVGYNVHAINDPRGFEDAFLAVKPDLLLLDVMLGPVSGFELARYVRSDDRFAATPIIFLTTQNQLNAHVESARVGGDEHLIKPVAPQLLIAAVSGRLERYRVLKKLIGKDGLTQFLTLASFMEAAEQMITRRYQSNGTMVLLLVDVDHMEVINDRWGYAAGDKVIESLSKLLKRRLRNAEIFARVDGDEFAVVMDGVDDRELAEVATQVIQEFEATAHTAAGQTFTATVSAGAAMLDMNIDLKQWIANAKLALKSAKTGGRNRVMKAKTRSMNR